MEAKIAQLWPEICLFITACIVMVVGLSPRRGVRGLCSPLTGLGLIVAGYLAWRTTPDGNTALPHLPMYAKLLTAGVGLLLLMLMAGTPDREYEAGLAASSAGGESGANGGGFDPIRSTRAEFYSFFLFSLMGLMMCAGADDLIFLFLALELTSLPTYVMVAISTGRNRSMEAGVKYFFLGALGAAIFLYGFALLYGATGHTDLAAIQQHLWSRGVNDLALIGLILSVLGVCFKIAAVPMHFYTPDVYQGASAPVGAFLAFVPKAAGFFAIMLLLTTVGWRFGDAGQALPDALRFMLWLIAVATMTIGNVLALLQTSVKRILAYSSIAHSGYMLVGVIAGPGSVEEPNLSRNGLGAVLFYLLTYGVMTLGAFAVLACMERRNKDGSVDEIDSIADIRGLCQTRPLLGWVLVISSMGLLGLPPLLGFFGKLPLFTSAIGAGEIVLVVILGLNSAIAAWYYLGLAKAALLEKPDPAATATPIESAPFVSRRVAGMLAAFAVLAMAVTTAGGYLGSMAAAAAKYRGSGPAERTPSAPPSAHADR